MLRKHLTPGRHDNIAIITTLTSILVNFLSAASVSSSTSSFSTPMTSQPRRLPSALESSSQSPPFGIHLTTLSSSSNRPSYELQVIVMEDGVTSATQTNATSSYCQHLTADEILANFTECLPPLPKGLYFSEDNAVSVAAYSCLFIVAACGNLTVFITLFRNRSSKSRINLFIMHLAIADLIVTFIMLPLEIAWHSTVAWMAGDAACRFFMFFRAMGFYLSSCILVSISLDRYFAIMRPLSITDAGTRAKVMLIVSWCLAIVASIPQSVIFHVETHPIFRWFQQCVTFNFFPSADHELAYNLFSIIALYGLPIAIITSSYCVILCRISKKSRQSKDEMSGKAFEGSHYQLRRSGIGNIERAKTRTLKMTLVIVGAYVMCWTPYFVMSAWYYFDRNSAIKIDPKVQRGLFIFAVSNSCINPIVYGMFTAAFRRESHRWGAWIKRHFMYNRTSTYLSSHPRFM
ncbi:adipokinetic hormone/corazonin-related peptide receptor variant I-like isoform X2 [Biomphalaria glabrata]|uniref:Adipokinetic hormone/corazonin-related peptide receptor variant I-like isoform X2 n=1 Tax=Biomphalaria glabrata TaxID=6526 RepID=A0A9W3A028_BIOGL|nr:adipokinetic hormone/corazonin-related peptide receptor variant I-like isoform X2 [Biomphalaria glabrata]